jgi:type IV pilus assembly protein PilC
VGLPLVGSLRKQLLLTRFLRHFALLYEAGIPVQRCLRLGRETLSNPLLAQAIKVVEEGIEGGAGVARAFAAGGTFSPRMVRMLHVGERSGRLGSALQHLVLILSEETRETVERLGRAVEPTLILVAGGFLIFLICAVLGPVYDVLGRLAH